MFITHVYVCSINSRIPVNLEVKKQKLLLQSEVWSFEKKSLKKVIYDLREKQQSILINYVRTWLIYFLKRFTVWRHLMQ